MFEPFVEKIRSATGWADIRFVPVPAYQAANIVLQPQNPSWPTAWLNVALPDFINAYGLGEWHGHGRFLLGISDLRFGVQGHRL